MNIPYGKNGEKGLIFNIQRFSIHDGPGIRTTVFMKGCPLRCLWCSNPEAMDSYPNLMVRDINCKACGACGEVCPTGAITFSRQEGRKIVWEKCDQCLKCVEACIYDALNVCGCLMTPEEVLDEVLKDEAFYRNSGGGLTVSGGEAMAQAEFAACLFQAAKQAGLHTALDTTGYAPWKQIEPMLPLVDLILWDIKHLDAGEHKRTTGASNALILANLKKASKTTDIWLRMPLIAGFNASEEHVKKLVDLGKRIDAQKISLLPYHEGGKSKCRQLGRAYPLPEAAAPAAEDIQHLKESIERQGIKATIGN